MTKPLEKIRNKNMPANFGLVNEELEMVFIVFEKSSSLRSIDTPVITRRVMLATGPNFLVLNHHPAIWSAQYRSQKISFRTQKGMRISMSLCSKQFMCKMLSELNDIGDVYVVKMHEEFDGAVHELDVLRNLIGQTSSFDLITIADIAAWADVVEDRPFAVDMISSMKNFTLFDGKPFL